MELCEQTRSQTKAQRKEKDARGRALKDSKRRKGEKKLLRAAKARSQIKGE